MQTKEQPLSENQGKKVYSAPQLTVHGTVSEITMDQNKMFGGSDGFLFLGTPIQNAS